MHMSVAILLGRVDPLGLEASKYALTLFWKRYKHH